MQSKKISVESFFIVSMDWGGCLVSLTLLGVFTSDLPFFLPFPQGLCLCLDFQFDTVVKDRPTILSKLLLLHFLKQDIPALSWEFFVNRFETLSLEAQLHLDCNKEFPFPTSKQNKELALNSHSSYSGACWINRRYFACSLISHYGGYLDFMYSVHQMFIEYLLW